MILNRRVSYSCASIPSRGSACRLFINRALKTPTITPNCGLSKLAGRTGSNACSPHSSRWRDRFRQMESLLVRVIDMHAAAVWPKQVKLGTHRAALRMWIPDDDSACMVWHVLYSFQTSYSEPCQWAIWGGCSTATPAASTGCPNNRCERYSTAASCSAGLFF
jgi:hypothetical protein